MKAGSVLVWLVASTVVAGRIPHRRYCTTVILSDDGSKFTDTNLPAATPIPIPSTSSAPISGVSTIGAPSANGAMKVALLGPWWFAQGWGGPSDVPPEWPHRGPLVPPTHTAVTRSSPSYLQTAPFSFHNVSVTATITTPVVVTRTVRISTGSRSTSSQEQLSMASSSTAASTQFPQAAPSQVNNELANDSWAGDKPQNMSYAKPIIDAHNVHRRNGSVPELHWNATMEQWSKQISATCYYSHSHDAGDGKYGQNIGAGQRPEEMAWMITNEMYNGEIGWYPGPYGSEPDMSNFEKWGHYTQIVWNKTQSVGCWTTDCTAQGLGNVSPGTPKFFTVCNYYPAGNVRSQFGKNVPFPGTDKTITIATPIEFGGAT